MTDEGAKWVVRYEPSVVVIEFGEPGARQEFRLRCDMASIFVGHVEWALRQAWPRDADGKPLRPE